jgi:hypothetical protein
MFSIEKKLILFFTTWKMSHIYESEGKRYLRVNVTKKNGETTTIMLPLDNSIVADDFSNELNIPQTLTEMYKQVTEQSKIVNNLRKQNNKDEIKAAVNTLSILQSAVAALSIKIHAMK